MNTTLEKTDPAIAAIDGLDIPQADRRKIYEDNIRRLARQRLRG